MHKGCQEHSADINSETAILDNSGLNEGEASMWPTHWHEGVELHACTYKAAAPVLGDVPQCACSHVRRLTSADGLSTSSVCDQRTGDACKGV